MGALVALQINASTGRVRPVRRNVVQPTGNSEWQWWEDEDGQWRPYDATINSQIEFAWEQCCNRNGLYQANAPAGFIIYIHRRKYTIQFEADAIQTNLTSHYSRKVRRRLVPAGPGVWVLGTVPTPQASGSHQTGPANSLSYNAEDLQAYEETSDDNDCPICVSSLVKKNAVGLSKCRHTFCKECIMRWFETRPTCPICNMAYGLITGMQPLGTMNIRILPAGSPEELQGYPNTEIIQIFYNFPNGVQVIYSVVLGFVSWPQFLFERVCKLKKWSIWMDDQQVRVVPRPCISLCELVVDCLKSCLWELDIDFSDFGNYFVNRVKSIQVQENRTQGHIGLRTCPRPKKVKKSLAF